MTRDPETGSALSFAQQRLWFFEQLGDQGPLYHVTLAKRLIGDLDVAALRDSVTDIVTRHESLRTIFPSKDGLPRQLVLPPAPVDLPVVDFASLAPDLRNAELRLQLDGEARRRFDLHRDPPLRGKLWKTAANEHVLLFVMHHIVSDGWSLPLFCGELSQLYRSRTTGVPAFLPDLPIQYPEYSRQQREWLAGEEAQKQLSYWKRQLAGAPHEIHFPTDRPRPTEQNFRGATMEFRVPEALAAAVRMMSRRYRATPFMIYLAGVKCLLHRHTGYDDLVVGIPIAGRTHQDIENLIGFFVNTLVLRSDISGSPSFREFLDRVRKVALDAYSHQDLPFERTVEELGTPRGNGYSPLFQVMFGFNNTGGQALSLSGLEVQPISVSLGDAKFDLVFSLTEEGALARGKIDYRTDLFDSIAIERLIGRYLRLLGGAVADPDCAVGRLPLLPEDEWTRIVRQWNDSAADYPRDGGIDLLFEAQARRSPDAIAVSYAGSNITYRELSQRSNQLAHELRARGIGPEVPVALFLERSPRMVIAMVAVLKAGGAYVPLDPGYPEERLSFMSSDSRAAIIITEPALCERIRACKGGASLLVMGADDISHQPESSLPPVNSAESLAYVIYTSGSTGVPKGVAVTHCAIARLVLNSNYVDLNPDDTIAQISNCSFDAATFEVWGALLNGASLSIIPKEIAISPRDLAEEIRRLRVTVMFLTTALFNLIAEEKPDAFASLRYVLFGGEAVQPRRVEKVMRAGPPAHLLHVYGPTETTTFATFHRVAAAPDRDRTIPIGRPISNTTIYILDRLLQPVPPCVSGEVFIAGDGLARGYWRRPSESGERFLPDPFGSSPGGRLYRTGDLARFLSNGEIEFLGRNDRQVKIRGFRIETAEIEAVLSAHPGLRNAAVVVLEAPEDRKLAAYVVPAQSPGPGQRALRSYLEQKLPEYMIPATFVSLESLPLNPNGKLDRGALPPPQTAAPDDYSRRERPLDATEKQLAEIWNSLIGRTRTEIGDNFFEVGGHSLLAVRLLHAIQKHFGAILSLADIFKYPTLEEMASAVRRQTGSEGAEVLVPLQPAGSLPPFFWIHGDHSNVLLPRYLDADQPLYAFLHQSHDGRPARYTEVRSIAGHYLELVRKIRPHGPYALGGYCFGGLVAHEMAQRLQELGEEIILLVLLEPTTAGKRQAGELQLPAGNFPLQLGRHLKMLKGLGMIRAAAYLVRGLAWRADLRTSRIRKFLKGSIVRFYLALGRPLPPGLQSPYLLDLYARAAKRYDIEPFNGPVLLIMGDTSTGGFEQYWRKLMHGELEVLRVTGGHMDLTKERAMAVIGERISARLRQAQPDEPGSARNCPGRQAGDSRGKEQPWVT